MLSNFARWCFALTALAPALGAAAIIAVSSHGSWAWGAGFATAGLLTIALSYLLLEFVHKYAQVSTLRIVEVEQADKHVLEFLVAYLLPVFSATTLTSMTGSIVLTIYSLVIVAATVVHCNIFQFNPVLVLFGYHFFTVKSVDGIGYLVISKTNFHKAERTIACKVIGEYIRLEVPA